jgi:hypothetical protein
MGAKMSPILDFHCPISGPKRELIQQLQQPMRARLGTSWHGLPCAELLIEGPIVGKYLDDANNEKSFLKNPA